ncbi:MAG: hypothetical protein RLZZ370_1688 [Bacteroidota bacterium]|jgi:hypothetical protein
MPNWKSIASSIIWLLLALPALLPAQVRPHVHLEIHAVESQANHEDDCVLCDTPILLDLPSFFQVAGPLDLPYVPAAAAKVPLRESPFTYLHGSRAPPVRS